MYKTCNSLISMGVIRAHLIKVILNTEQMHIYKGYVKKTLQ